MKIKCACGCGKDLPPEDSYGRSHYFINGHNRRGKLRGSKIPCVICGKIIYRKPSAIRKHNVCSKKCFKSALKLWVSGKQNYHWKGYFKHGVYKGLRKKNHPMADKQGRILEHRFVMAKVIKRNLTKKEIVHHINGNPLDNKPSNLQIMTPSEHKRLHLLTPTPKPLPS